MQWYLVPRRNLESPGKTIQRRWSMCFLPQVQVHGNNELSQWRVHANTRALGSWSHLLDVASIKKKKVLSRAWESIYSTHSIITHYIFHSHGKQVHQYFIFIRLVFYLHKQANRRRKRAIQKESAWLRSTFFNQTDYFSLIHTLSLVKAGFACNTGDCC